jgi:hypothetical protein
MMAFFPGEDKAIFLPDAQGGIARAWLPARWSVFGLAYILTIVYTENGLY